MLLPDSTAPAIKLIHEAKARIERGWCQGGWAVNDFGIQVPASSPHAIAWSLHGAILAGVNLFDVHSHVLFYLRLATNNNDLQFWNDLPGRTKVDVLGALDQAGCLLG